MTTGTGMTTIEFSLETYIGRFVSVLLEDYSLCEGKLKRVPSGVYCLIGTDGKFVRAGRKILAFTEADVFALIADGWLCYIRAKVRENGDGAQEGAQGGKD